MFFIICSETESSEIIPTYLANKEKLENAWILDYNFIFQVSCYCPEEYTLPKKVLVRGGEIVTVNNLVYS